MARIYMVKRRLRDGRWDMTVSSDEEGWAHAIGYCAGWNELTEADCKRLLGPYHWPSIQEDQEARRQFQSKYHVDGHNSSAEAEACYLNFLLDQEIKFHEEVDTQKRCKMCGVWTTGYGSLGREIPRRWPLCKTHQTRKSIEELVRKP